MFDDDGTLWRRRTRMFGHRSAQYAWLWERSWGKLVILAPILFLVGVLLSSVLKDREASEQLKASFAQVCILETSAQACDQGVAAHHQTCFNIASMPRRGQHPSYHDEALYHTCVSRRMRGLSALAPRPGAE